MLSRYFCFPIPIPCSPEVICEQPTIAYFFFRFSESTSKIYIGDVDKIYIADEGQLVLTAAAPGGRLTGYLEDAVLHEVEIDQNGNSSLVAGGGMWCLDGYQFDEAMDEAPEIRVVVLGHIQRGGTPVAEDRIIATACGSHAVDMLADGLFGYMSAFGFENQLGLPTK